MMPCFRLTPVLRPVLAFLLIGGCASAPGERYYALTNTHVAVTTTEANHQADALVIAIGPVSLPNLVDRPQIVTRNADQSVTISEQNRWAASLQSQIGQVLADGLAQQLETPFVSVYPQEEIGKPDVRLNVTLQRFDAQLGKEVLVDAIWSAKNTRSGLISSGRAAAQAPVNKDESYAAIVTAYRNALDRLAQQIAVNVRATLP